MFWSQRADTTLYWKLLGSVVMVVVWKAVFGVLLVLLILFPFTSVRIHLIYRRKGEKDHLELRFRLFFGWIRFRVKVPTLRLDRTGVEVRSKSKGNIPGSYFRQKWRLRFRKLRNTRQNFLLLRQRIVQLNELLLETYRRFMSHVVCERLEWMSCVGTGDAASTGVIAGMVWGVKSTLIGFAGPYIRWRATPRIDVQPLFNSDRIETNLESIIRFRIGYAILAVIRLLFGLMRNRKGGKGSWQNTQFKA